MSRRWSPLLFLALVAGQGAAAPPAVAAVPHQATYQLAFHSMKLPGAVTRAGGVMSIKLEEACDGWTTHLRIAFQLATSEGTDIDLQSGVAQWESRDGLDYKFFVQTNVNGAVAQRVAGEARLDAPTGAGTARYNTPVARSVKLPAGTRFPIHAWLRTVDGLRDGAMQFQSTVFDGTTGDGPYLASDLVVGAPVPLANRPRGDADLLSSPAWRLRSAYFDLANAEGTPIGELTAQTHENMVVTRMIMDFEKGDVVLFTFKVNSTTSPF
jgi:hypothetical protein